MEYNTTEMRKIRNTQSNGKYLRLAVAAALFASIMTTLPQTLVVQEAEAQQTMGLNWGEICRNPIVDAVIVEPCSTLTTNGGYTLTFEGERVVKCIAGGAALLIYDPSGQTLAAAQALGPAVGCGSTSGALTGLPVSDVFSPSSQYVQDSDPLGDILRTLFD